jgi:hypothetical protein
LEQYIKYPLNIIRMQEILEPKTKHIFEKIRKTEILEGFYLAGGTGLALQFGHRKSIDLDFFNPNVFSTNNLKNILKDLGELEIINEEKDNTLNCVLEGVKLSFFEYPYKMLFPTISYEGSDMADFRDIACMKIDAISSRGSKKDFIDIYFILKKISLREILDLFDEKYKDIKYSRMHLLKSLNYFEEAEKEPMPMMLESIEWKNVKKDIQKTINEYLNK